MADVQLTAEERVAAWLDDDADLRIPDTEWGRSLYEALRDLTARSAGAAALETAVREALDEVVDPIHAGGCYYRHQQGDADECNSCTAHIVETAVRAVLDTHGTTTDPGRDERARCGCQVGGLHSYGCGLVGHVDPPRRSTTTDPIHEGRLREARDLLTAYRQGLHPGGVGVQWLQNRVDELEDGA